MLVQKDLNGKMKELVKSCGAFTMHFKFNEDKAIARLYIKTEDNTFERETFKFKSHDSIRFSEDDKFTIVDSLTKMCKNGLSIKCTEINKEDVPNIILYHIDNPDRNNNIESLFDENFENIHMLFSINDMIIEVFYGDESLTTESVVILEDPYGDKSFNSILSDDFMLDEPLSFADLKYIVPIVRTQLDDSLYGALSNGLLLNYLKAYKSDMQITDLLEEETLIRFKNKLYRLVDGLGDKVVAVE